MKEKKCGIYKITSPSGKIYIGQSINIERRLKQHKYSKNNTILNKSLKKYGYENHIFEIIELCDIKELNKKERYYQDYYKAFSKNGLNCKLTKTNDKSGKLSKETKNKLKEKYEERRIKMLEEMWSKKYGIYPYMDEFYEFDYIFKREFFIASYNTDDDYIADMLMTYD